MSDDIQKIESLEGGQVAQNVYGDMIYKETNYYTNHAEDVKNENIKEFIFDTRMSKITYDSFVQNMDFIESQKILSEYKQHKFILKINIPKLDQLILSYHKGIGNSLEIANEIKDYEIAKRCCELFVELCHKSIIVVNKINVHHLWIQCNMFLPNNFLYNESSTVANYNDDKIDKFIETNKYLNLEGLQNDVQYLQLFHYIAFPQLFIFKNKFHSLEFYFEQRTVIADNEFDMQSKDIKIDIFSDDEEEFLVFRDDLFLKLIKEYIYFDYIYDVDEYFHLKSTYSLIYSEKQKIIKDMFATDERVDKWFYNWCMYGMNTKYENNYEMFTSLDTYRRYMNMN